MLAVIYYYNVIIVSGLTDPNPNPVKCNKELEMMGCEGPTKTVRSVACDGALSRCDCELLIEVVVEDLEGEVARQAGRACSQ